MRLDTLMTRLDADLLAARRAGYRPEVAAIGSLKTALGDAGAVPVEERPYTLIEGTADVRRRELGPSEVEAILEREREERRRAIGEYRRAGLDTSDLESELAALDRYRNEQ